ncbi:aminotransferase class I/II-fold pyridoxal phosphate-dependent enzyme [Dickeya poaceiphila]|nr:aminotransferase class I/II-fold pyridoxal phosphate-dependent enzyme [Dickeya poaceiphila]
MLNRAIDSYRHLSLDDTPTLLNLAWTKDERDFITPPLPSLIEQSLYHEIDRKLPDIWHYAVDDPWGERRLTPAVCSYFGVKEDGLSLSCGAGVIQLLSVLPALSVKGSVAVADEIYPDFPWWLKKSGRSVWRIRAKTVTGCVKQAISLGADVFFIERPGVREDTFMSLDTVYELGMSLAGAGITLLIDESNANYQPPSYSAVHLLAYLPNIIVLRGVSKAWGLGSLRTGLCISSPALKETLREIIPPLLNPSLTLRIVHDVLTMGDSTAWLRARIQQQKQAAIMLFEGWPVMPSSNAMPYLFLPTNEETTLRHLGIGTKRHHFWQEADTTTTLLRLSVPLQESRMLWLENVLKGEKR